MEWESCREPQPAVRCRIHAPNEHLLLERESCRELQTAVRCRIPSLNEHAIWSGNPAEPVRSQDHAHGFCYCLELATPPLAILSIFSCFAALAECVNALPARGAQGSAPGMHFRRRSEKRPAGAPARWEPTKSKKADSAARFPTKCPGGT